MKKKIAKALPNGAFDKRLAAFAGVWDTSGEILSTAIEEAIPIKGTDTYEWLPGGFFLFHRVDVWLGNQRNQSVEIIGPEKKARNYSMHSFDSTGNRDTMQAVYDKGKWMFKGESMRFSGKFNGKANMVSGIWEQKIKGKWKPYMTIKLSRANEK